MLKVKVPRLSPEEHQWKQSSSQTCELGMVSEIGSNTDNEAPVCLMSPVSVSHCLLLSIIIGCQFFFPQIIRTTRTRRAIRVIPSAVVTTCRSVTPVLEDATTLRSADWLSLANQVEFSAPDSLVLSGQVTDLRMAQGFVAEAVNGPTTEGGLPVFSWEAFNSTAHQGLPPSYNFSFVSMQPQLFQPWGSWDFTSGLLLNRFSIRCLSLTRIWALQSVESAFILNAKLYSCHLTISPGLCLSLLIDGLRKVNRNALLHTVCLSLWMPVSCFGKSQLSQKRHIYEMKSWHWQKVIIMR